MAKNKREKEKEKRRKSNALQWAKEQEKQQGGGCFRLPDGVEVFKPEPGRHKFDVMPYIVKGDTNPRADDGMIHFERQYDRHVVPVAGGKRYVVCRAATFKQKCAVCQWLKRNGGTADEELVKDLRGKTRHLWLVNDTPGKLKKWKVWETPHFKGFGEQLGELLQANEDFADFADLENGLTVQVLIKEESFGGGKFNAVVRADLLPRKYTYPEDLLDDAPCLDEMLVDPGYDEVMELLEDGESVKDDDDKPLTPFKKDKPDSNDDDDDPEDPSDLEEEEPSTKKGKGKAPKKPDPDDDDDEPEDPSDLDDEDSEIDSDLEDSELEEEPPVKKGKGKKK